MIPINTKEISACGARLLVWTSIVNSQVYPSRRTISHRTDAGISIFGCDEITVNRSRRYVVRGAYVICDHSRVRHCQPAVRIRQETARKYFFLTRSKFRANSAFCWLELSHSNCQQVLHASSFDSDDVAALTLLLLNNPTIQQTHSPSRDA